MPKRCAILMAPTIALFSRDRESVFVGYAISLRLKGKTTCFYPADGQHNYVDASDEPAANADFKNVEHELE